MSNSKNYVFKRDGRKEEVHLDKITSRIKKLCYGLNMDCVEPVAITLKTIGGLYPGITTVELDTLAAETAVMMSTDHPDYGTLAARIAISNLHKETKKDFSDVIEDLYNAVDLQTEERTPLISPEHYAIIKKNSNRLNSHIIYDRDFFYNYFAFKKLEQTCLLKINGKTAERPQHMLMRVAVGIHGEDIDSVIESYNYMSEKYFIHTQSTLLSAATPEPDLFSSYLLTMPEDSLDGIYECIRQCAIVSDTGADVGVSIHNIRAKGTDIAGTGGVSNGLVPMLRVFSSAASYSEVNSESQAIYLEPWHADIMEFLNLKRFSGKDEYRARELVYALWVPDLFMERMRNNKMWSLMCPHRCQGLLDCWGEEFDRLYEKYESEGNFTKQIPARDVWRAICVTQIETGSPFMLYKDACNRKSNQQNLGVIRNGSRCTELIQFTSSEEIATCAMASIAVNMFVNSERNEFDFEKLKQVVKILTRDLNKIIDVSSYALPQAKESSLKHRPIGIGVQGLADTFILLGFPYGSKDSRLLNTKIFETIYYGALEASSEMAEKEGPYSSYEGSPASKGLLQYDLWNVAPTDLWNWESLKQRISKHGIRNSLLTAVMPTTVTAQILGNNESTGPFPTYVEERSVSSGKFKVVNQLLLKDLTDRGVWSDSLEEKIIAKGGSIQLIPDIPEYIKVIYRTAWEISQKVIFDMAADRGAFVDQSQAMSIHIPEPSHQILDSMHFYAWKKGLKTGMHVLNMNPTCGYTRSQILDVPKVQVRQTNGVSNGVEAGKNKTEKGEVTSSA